MKPNKNLVEPGNLFGSHQTKTKILRYKENKNKHLLHSFKRFRNGMKEKFKKKKKKRNGMKEKREREKYHRKRKKNK